MDFKLDTVDSIRDGYLQPALVLQIILGDPGSEFEILHSDCSRDEQVDPMNLDTSMTHPSELSISRDAISRNLDQIRSIGDQSEEIGVVLKADGYGIGAVGLLKLFQELDVRWFFTFNPTQAAELLPALSDKSNLLILRSRTTREPSDACQILSKDPRCHWMIHDESELDWLLELATSTDATLDVHLDVDTGMNRGGCPVRMIDRILERLESTDALTLAGLSSHLATADSDSAFANEQGRIFLKYTDCRRPEVIRHLQNSHARLGGKMRGLDLCRVGLAAFGYSENEELVQKTELTPALSWRSSICQLRTVAAGESIGYGRSYFCDRDSVIGVVPVGYADGYPARAATNTPFEVGIWTTAGIWEYVPVVGLVNMDQITIDLTHVAGSLEVGQSICLLSDEVDSPNSPRVLAERAGTIVYDILCGIGQRVTRRWT